MALGLVGLWLSFGRRGPSVDNRYLAELATAGLTDQFTADRAAIANAHRICKKLDEGGNDVGYERDRLGVKFYCSEYYENFRVVPTPEEQEKRYLTALRKNSQMEEFDTDEQAIAHAKSVCQSLDSGSDPEGTEAEKTGVTVYCSKYAKSFRVLETATIQGEFTVLNSDPSEYYSAIDNPVGNICSGSGGYSDIDVGTRVEVRSGTGELLGSTELSMGHGSEYSCTFDFELELTEGEESYVVAVGRRGEIDYSWEELKVGPSLTLGE